MSTKKIELTQNFIENITSIEETQKETKKMIINITDRFMNENNYNIQQKAIEELEYYRYIPSKAIIPDGSTVKFIYVKSPDKMKLLPSGFVLSNDTKYFKYLSYGKTLTVNRYNVVAFIKLKSDEALRCALNDAGY